MESVSPKDFPSTAKPITDQALQGGNVAVPGSSNTAETAGSKDGKGNTVNPPPTEVAAPKTESSQK